MIADCKSSTSCQHRQPYLLPATWPPSATDPQQRVNINPDRPIGDSRGKQQCCTQAGPEQTRVFLVVSLTSKVFSPGVTMVIAHYHHRHHVINVSFHDYRSRHHHDHRIHYYHRCYNSSGINDYYRHRYNPKQTTSSS